nr:MAG TPA: hypothetical protein [Caudoviricetes sp.]
MFSPPHCGQVLAVTAIFAPQCLHFTSFAILQCPFLTVKYNTD